MKRIVFFIIILLSTCVLHAQDGTKLYKQEVKLSVGDAVNSETFFHNGKGNINLSATYYYPAGRKFWVGINVINYFGDKIYYNWREYATDGTFDDLSKSKKKYCLVIAPEIRWSYFYNKSVNLYSAFSGGIGWENGFDDRTETYPRKVPYLHLTCFGFDIGLGKNKKFIIGGELGLGFKGVFDLHGGYRF